MTQQPVHDWDAWPYSQWYGVYTPTFPSWPSAPEPAAPLVYPPSMVQAPVPSLADLLVVTELRRALGMFGDHRVRCRVIQESLDESCCTCGWNAVKTIFLADQ